MGLAVLPVPGVWRASERARYKPMSVQKERETMIRVPFSLLTFPDPVQLCSAQLSFFIITGMAVD